MKRISVIMFVLLCCISMLFAEAKEKGPFGTTWLSSKEELAKVGTLELFEDHGEYAFYYFTPNKGHSAFDYYLAVVLKDGGFVKIVAIGKNISCNEYGTALKTAYNDMKATLTNSYGKPDNDYDFNTSSLWSEASDWMYSLYKEYRFLACSWELDNYYIILDANASSSSVGYIRLTYEHNKWGEYVEKRNASENDNL